MAQVHAASGTKERPAVLGVRVSVDLRTKIKVAAARRGVTIAELFEEMWQAYLKQQQAREP
jgi:hypothetical protein